LVRQFLAQTQKNVVVAAPTGIAALNVNGYTVHRLFGFTATTTLADVRTGTYRPGRFTKTLASLDTLIIDEASMVRADLFDMLAAALQRFGPEPGAPFGGVQIVLVGDLYQLPPVVTEHEAAFFTTRYETPYFFSADTFRRDEFPTVALTTVFRQLGDDRMTAILNEIREGVLLGHAQEQLNARTDPDFVPPDDEFWLTLAPTNRLVTARNRQHLERLEGDEFSSRARQYGDLSLFDPPADEVLRFKVGAQVMMLNNDQSGRWVNGTLGRITDIHWSTNDLTVTVDFTDGTDAEVAPFTWEATRPVVDGGTLRHEVVGSFTQLPFKLAWAITIHKSQGQTLDRLIVDLTGGMFSTGQLYVALSRATSMKGLVLKRPVLPKDLKTDRRIARFLHGAVDERPRRFCSIGMLTVGEEGRMSRPRPVELAVAFDDGTAISSVINPQRDLADARVAYGISVSDVLLAPTLAQAWSVLAPMLAGCTPVGAGIDETLGLIDFELKRLGHVIVMPLGLELRRARIAGRTALQRAQSVFDVFDGEVTSAATPFGEPDPETALCGHLLTRDHTAPTPVSVALPALTALLEISRGVSQVLLTGNAAPAGPDTPWLAAARHTAAYQLRCAASRVRLTETVLSRLREVENLLGVEVVDEAMREAAAGDDIDSVLTPGARICFTGTALDSDGREVPREQMERLAAAAGLAPVKSVTKTRCEVLVTAEEGTQSGKARKAVELGKTVVTADEFFAWLETR
jgi:hypothetical protein